MLHLSLCLVLAAAPGPDAGVNAEPGAALVPPVVNLPAKNPAPETMPFNQDTIRELVHLKQPQIERCWEQYLATQDKPVDGKLHTKFVITPAGTVRTATVLKKGTTVKNSELHKCVSTVLSTMTFPKPPDGKDHPVEYPFNLKAVR